jgi:hypothetical protein
MEQDADRMQNARCIMIKRTILSFSAPKKCRLNIRLSEKITDIRFIDTIYRAWQDKAEVPSKLSRNSEKEFEVEIGTCFKRCTDCIKLINRYREFLEGNLIDEKGSCDFEGFKKNFCYEDYFD